MNFYDEVLGEEDPLDPAPHFGGSAGFQREFSLEQLQPVCSEQDSSEEDPSEEKFAPVFESAPDPEPSFKKQQPQLSAVDRSESEKELRETIKYLVVELQEAKKKFEAAEKRARDAWEDGVQFGRDQQLREKQETISTFDEESMSREIKGLKRLLEESERVRKELQSRLVSVAADFDKKVEEVKAQMQARAATKDLSLEKRLAELEARNRLLQEELDRAKSATDKQQPAPKQIKFNREQARTTPDLSPAQKRQASKSPLAKDPHGSGSRRSPSPSPSPAAVSAYLETIHKLELENKKLKDHLRIVLHSPKNTNVASVIATAGPATPDLQLVTSLLLKTDPSLLIVPINDTTLEVNKRRVVLVLHHGKTMVKGKHSLLSVQEFADNYKK